MNVLKSMLVGGLQRVAALSSYLFCFAAYVVFPPLEYMVLLPARTFARRGARLLDKTDPEWVTKISPTILDLSNGNTCVLGQLFGSYMAGRFQLRLRGFLRAETHGFQQSFFASYRDLQRAWEEILMPRLWEIRRKEEENEAWLLPR